MPQRGPGRREVLQRLVATLGAGFTLPSLAAGHPMRRHLRDHAKVAAAEARASAGSRPEFLDVGQLETLVQLAERIVPGSTGAEVPPFIDQLLAVDTPDNQRAFLNALRALAGPVERLAQASTERPAVAPQPPTLRDHFEHLKGWIVGAYYSSEIGMRELGWTGNVFYAGFPGCPHPGGHR